MTTTTRDEVAVKVLCGMLANPACILVCSDEQGKPIDHWRFSVGGVDVHKMAVKVADDLLALLEDGASDDGEKKGGAE